jgi:hypothetical protein
VGVRLQRAILFARDLGFFLLQALYADFLQGSHREDFKSRSRQTASVTMGHILHERGSLSGDPLGIVTHENRYSPTEQAKFRPSWRCGKGTTCLS